MFDLHDLYNKDNENFSIFYHQNSWQQWTKPSTAKIVHFLCVGGGGGGGAGAQAVAGTANRGGGGGGSSSSYISATFPALFLPDILSIWVGSGGTGGTVGNVGSVGGDSYVCVVPEYTPESCIIFASGGNYGINGVAGSAGSGGFAPIANNITRAKFLSLGNFSTAGAAAGVAGNTSTGSNPATQLSNCFLGRGNGGGGTTTSNIVSAAGGGNEAIVLSLIPSSDSSATGSNGYHRWRPFCSSMVVGGGASGTGTGANGANGSIGNGGGGGGAGVTGGAGGKGGDGIIFILSI